MSDGAPFRPGAGPWQPPVVRVHGVDAKSPQGQQLLAQHAGAIRQFYHGQAQAHELGIVDQTRGRKDLPGISMQYTNAGGQEIIDVIASPRSASRAEPQVPVEPAIYDHVIINLAFPDSTELYAATVAYTEIENGAVPEDDNWATNSTIIWADNTGVRDITTGDINYGASLWVDMSRLPDTVEFDVLLFARAWPVQGYVWQHARWGVLYLADYATNLASVRDETFVSGVVCTEPYQLGNTYPTIFPTSWYTDGDYGFGGTPVPAPSDLPQIRFGNPGDTWPPYNGTGTYYRDPYQLTYPTGLVWWEEGTAIAWPDESTDYGPCGVPIMTGRLRDWFARYVLYRGESIVEYQRYGTREFSTYYLTNVTISYTAHERYTQFDPVYDASYTPAASISYVRKALWVPRDSETHTPGQVIGSAVVPPNLVGTWTDPDVAEPPGWALSGYPYLGRVHILRAPDRILTCEWLPAGSGP